MSGYIAFLKKELMENTLNFKLVVMFAVFAVLGILSPVSTKFMPDIVSALTPQLGITFSEPAALDSWGEFYDNVSSLGMSLMLIIFSGCLSSEYNKGTLIIMLTKGLPRPAVIVAKFSSAVVIMTVSYWICFGITYGYTAYLWAGEALPHIFFAAFCLWSIGVMYLSILILGCVVFRQAFPSIIFIFVTLGVLGLVGMIKPLAKYNPLNLTGKNIELLSGTAVISDFIYPLIIALFISLAFLITAISLFNKKQL